MGGACAASVLQSVGAQRAAMRMCVWECVGCLCAAVLLFRAVKCVSSVVRSRGLHSWHEDGAAEQLPAQSVLSTFDRELPACLQQCTAPSEAARTAAATRAAAASKRGPAPDGQAAIAACSKTAGQCRRRSEQRGPAGGGSPAATCCCSQGPKRGAARPGKGANPRFVAHRQSEGQQARVDAADQTCAAVAAACCCCRAASSLLLLPPPLLHVCWT